MSPPEFTKRRRLVENLDFQDATARVFSFLEWVEADERGRQVLHHLREEVDINDLIKEAGFQRPPQPGTPDEVAAVALCIIENARKQKTQLFQIAFALGLHGGSSSHVQDTQNELEARYLQPFYTYLEEHLFPVSQQSEGTVEVHSVAMNITDVFIVHGREEALKETVARFLSKLGLNPIILHEQADRGRTIIEKFEDHAAVGFAIVLLTPDDAGGLAGEPARPRARQNVVFELGYFLGRLGRGRVMALRRGKDLELPSDYAGVIYTSADEGGDWKLTLVRELRAAGFAVDANRAF